MKVKHTSCANTSSIDVTLGATEKQDQNFYKYAYRNISRGPKIFAFLTIFCTLSLVGFDIYKNQKDLSNQMSFKQNLFSTYPELRMGVDSLIQKRDSCGNAYDFVKYDSTINALFDEYEIKHKNQNEK